MIRAVVALPILLSVVAAAAAEPNSPPRPLRLLEAERYGDAPALVWRTDSSPQRVAPFGNFTSYQVNVGANAANVVGDAANEPSITIDPSDRRKMSVGWRQFNSVYSNFRQGGYAYTTDGGVTWVYPGVLDGSFRSDPVLASDAAGSFFYLSLVPNFFDDIWRSDTRGQSWGRLGPATGGDKQWFVIDDTNSAGRGFQYQSWNSAGNNYNGRQFTRSTNGGLTWMEPIYIPSAPSVGTLAVDTDGNVFVGGVNIETGVFWCVRSSDAKNALVIPTFDRVTPVDLGGYLVGSGGINPAGLAGQVYLVIDHSGTNANNNVYMLASVQPYDNTNATTDVFFAKSTDGGLTFSAPRRINDDAHDDGSWHWFGTLAVAPNGRLDVVWLDSRNAANHTDSQLFYAFSTDSGENWSANVPVSDPFNPYLGYPNQLKIGDYIGLVSDNDGGNVAYCATFNQEQDIYYVRVSPAAAALPLQVAIRSITRDANGVTLIFRSQVNQTYRCELSNALGSEWKELQTNIVGTGGDIPVSDASAAQFPQRFYRVVVLP